MPVACEPRHASWFTPDVNDWLDARRVARVAADPTRVAGAGEPGGWSGLAYYRWHGSPRIYYSDYDEVALAALGRRLDAHRQRGVTTWCILDNTALGAALGNALALGKKVAADGVLFGSVNKYRERVGFEYSAQMPSSTARMTTIRSRHSGKRQSSA